MTRTGSSRSCAPSSASRPSRSSATTAGNRPSPLGDAFSRQWPSNGRSWSSSRTCTGRTRACSTSWTSSSTGSRTCRCWRSQPRGPSCSSGAPAGVAASSMRRRSRCRRSARTRRRSSSRSSWSDPCCPPSRSRRCWSVQAAIPSMPSSSPSSSSNGAPPTSSGFPRRSRASSRPASTGLPTPRRTCCATPPSSARCSGRLPFAMAQTRRRPCTRSSARDSCAARSARPSKARPSLRFPTPSFATSPTGRSPEPTVPRSTAASRSGSRRLGRPEDHAEMLAHHWHSAFELARAAGVEAPELADKARAGSPRSRRPCGRPQRVSHGREVLRGGTRSLARTMTLSARFFCFVEPGHST